MMCSTTQLSFCAMRSRGPARRSLPAHEPGECRGHVVEPWGIQSGINTDEEAVVHHYVGSYQIANDAVPAPLACRMTQQAAGEQAAGFHSVALEEPDDVDSG